jgi:hypothetical protein
MYIVNHFLDLQIGSILVPDDPADSTTNSASNIEAQVNLCNGMYGRMPNGVLVDYFNIGKCNAPLEISGDCEGYLIPRIGDVFDAQNYMNGL